MLHRTFSAALFAGTIAASLPGPLLISASSFPIPPWCLSSPRLLSSSM